MSHVTRYYPESRFGGFTDLDGTVAFYARLQALCTPESVVLDIGCGRGAHVDDAIPFRRGLRIFRGKARRVIGLDPDPAAADNPYVDAFHPIETSGAWPVEDASVDLAFADMVVEHLDDPDAFFIECARVLRPDGVLGLRTPNSRSYVALAARLIPNRRHANVLARVQAGRKAEDVFPTRYRCNTAGRLRHALRRRGFDAVVYGYEAEPSYLEFSRLAYFLGVLHQRFAPGFLKTTLFAFAQRDRAAARTAG